MGGYQGAEGKHVVWGKIYRSFDISKLTQKDIDVLASKNIGNVVDLRGVKESAAAPDRLPLGVKYVLSPAGSDSLNKLIMSKAARLTNGD